MEGRSLRSIAREMGVSHSLLSRWLRGKRTLAPALQVQYHSLCHQNGDSAPAVSSYSTPARGLARRQGRTLGEAVAAYIASRAATRGLTPRGREWCQSVLGDWRTWCQRHRVMLGRETADDIVRFLSQWEQWPAARRSHFQGLRAFYRWVSRSLSLPNPLLDGYGNLRVECPKEGRKLLPTQTKESVETILAATPALRDRALVSLLADSGMRLTEVASARVEDVDLPHCRIRVLYGKGRKQGMAVFGSTTQRLLAGWMEGRGPADSLFGLTRKGIQGMLRKVERVSGLKANAHSFRRGFATELRRQGVGDLDIMQLGRWENLAMVQRYTRAYKFEDAAKHYHAIVTGGP